MAEKNLCIDCGKEISCNALRCNSCRAKRQWESPEFRRNQSEKAKKRWESPESRRNQSEKCKDGAKRLWGPGGARAGERREKRYCIDCGKELDIYGNNERCHSCAHRTPAFRQQVAERWELGGSLDHQRGSGHPRWRGGPTDYGCGFTEKLRKSVRERDGNVCALCGKLGSQVHHINYDKNNHSPDNLITLCVSCHGRTNARRKYWERKFKRMR